jgi:hypothetical protein
MSPTCMRCLEPFHEKEACLYLESHRIITTEPDAQFYSSYDSQLPQPSSPFLCFPCVMVLNLEVYLLK